MAAKNPNLRMSLFALETVAHLQPQVFKPPVTVRQILAMVDGARRELAELEGGNTPYGAGSLEPLITPFKGESDHAVD